MAPLFVVLYHPFILLEILIRAVAGSALAALALSLWRPRDPRVRHAGWMLVLGVTPAVLPLWFLIPELEIPGLPGAGILVVEATAAPLEAGAAVPRLPARRSLPPVVTAWLVVAALRLGWVARGARDAIRLRRRARPIGSFGAPPVRVALSDHVRVPVTAGLVRPVILLPAGAERWTGERRAAVLWHEHAHVRRRDPATTWLAELLVALFWFNPVVWAARRELLRAAEHAADAAAAARMPTRAAYAQALVSIASLMVGRSRRLVGHVTFGGGSLTRRVEAVLDSRSTGSTLRVCAAIAGTLALVAALACVAASVTPDRGLLLSSSAPPAHGTAGS